MFGAEEDSVSARVSAVLMGAPVRCIKAVLEIRGINCKGISEKCELISLLSDSHSDLWSELKVCDVCNEDGSLLVCEGCIQGFHEKCLELKESPGGAWFCSRCKKYLPLDTKELAEAMNLHRPIPVIPGEHNYYF